MPVLVCTLTVTAALAGVCCRNNGNMARSHLTADSVKSTRETIRSAATKSAPGQASRPVTPVPGIQQVPGLLLLFFQIESSS